MAVLPAEHAIRTDTKSAASQIRADVGIVFGNCVGAYHAFGNIGELAENLRVLSLNAELAAGRAGDRGRAIRVLTQYTRELVNRLMQVHRELTTIKSATYAQSATVLRILHRTNFIEQATARVAAPPSIYAERDRQGTLQGLTAAGRKDVAAIAVAIQVVLDGVGQLSRQTQHTFEVVSQSDSIATNIAIEAASAGPFEEEFNHVARTMRDYVETLRNMIEEAMHAVRNAAKSAQILRAKTAEMLGQGSGTSKRRRRRISA